MTESAERRQTLLIYTDDTVLAYGAELALSSLDGFDIVTAVPELSELIPLAMRIEPQIILVDITPEITVGLISALRKSVKNARIILWGRSFSEELTNQASELGVAGLLCRGTKEQFLTAVTRVSQGEQLLDVGNAPANSKKVMLTRRESQLVTLLAQGLRNKEIGTCLGITEGTVRMYLSKLFVKIGARDRFEVAVFGLKNTYCAGASWDGKNGFVTESDHGRARPVLRSLVLVEPKRRSGYAALPQAAGQ